MRFSDIILPISLAVTTVSAGVVGRRAAFTLQNGLDAQALNRKFQGLTASSACTTGETACVGSQLAQCVGDKFALSSCAASLQCVALPLVNKPGTSVTCDTPQDAQDRIAATGAAGGLVGKREVEERSTDEQRVKVEQRAAFTLQNGLDAQALNRKFQGLAAGSKCTTGETACVNGQLAQCVDDQFDLSSCAPSLQCVALPLVNKPGTSITCDTPQDAVARIGATGATGGLLGKRANVERRAPAAFTLQNGLDAQALNRKFQGLTPSSACNDGETACINDQLAQCASGKFVLSSCGGSLQCVALPLVLKPGTSITCDTPQDAATRIGATGAQGGLLGKREIAEPAIWARAAATTPPACAAKTKRADTTVAGAILKRIAQTDLAQVAQSWQDLCVQSGGDRSGAGGDPCVKLAGQNGISALLANADPCAQQDNADAMVDFAKSPGVKNAQALIANAVAYRKHPRNALNINGVVPSTLFCERAPRNTELSDVVNAQLQGVDPGLFGSPNTGVVAFGAPGTCPFGKTADVASCSCK